MTKKRTSTPEPEPTDEPTKGRPYSVYLNRDLAAGVDRIADLEADGSTHAVIQVALKWFIREYDAGHIKLKKKVVTRLDLD